MKTLNLICAVVFMFAGAAGMVASLFWDWVPPASMVSAVAFTALMGAAAESVNRLSKN